MSERFLRRQEVEKLIGVGRATLYANIAAGHFPKPVKLFPAKADNATAAWPESVVRRWMDERMREAGYEPVAIMEPEPIADTG